MKPKYNEDNYIVIFFDSMGSRIASMKAESYLDAREKGEYNLRENLAKTYAVLRVLYNSGQPHTERYDVAVFNPHISEIL